ncbi:MAG: hypothetical protein U0802_14705 [Candidatus Binatia bacterium]
MIGVAALNGPQPLPVHAATRMLAAPTGTGRLATLVPTTAAPRTAPPAWPAAVE